jgi:hypothetical protein
MDVVVIPAPTRRRIKKERKRKKKIIIIIIPRSVARAFILPERRNEMAESSEKLKTASVAADCAQILHLLYSTSLMERQATSAISARSSKS